MAGRSLKAKDKDVDKPATWAPTAANADPPSAGLELEGDVVTITARGKWERFFNGARNVPVADMVFSQAASLGSHKKRIDEKSTNFVLGFIDAMQPRDAAETLLLTQMAAIHQATMMLARRLNHVETIPQQDAAERALNKLTRSYAAQMDTLKRYRSKGQQIVRVERVTVENGAQAVVGNVNHGGRGEDET